MHKEINDKYAVDGLLCLCWQEVRYVFFFSTVVVSNFKASVDQPVIRIGAQRNLYLYIPRGGLQLKETRMIWLAVWVSQDSYIVVAARPYRNILELKRPTAASKPYLV